MDARRLAWVKFLRKSLIFMLLPFALIFHASVAFAGLGANLIPNPSLEAGTTVPTGWLNIKSGVATVAFKYPVPGNGDTKAAQVNVSAYTSGDEYWQPPTVNVTAGQKYQFSAYSMSSVPVPVIATYVKSAGGNLFANLGTVPASSTWQLFTKTVTIPAGVNKVRIQHVLQAKGTLSIDNYALQLVTADNTPAPTCTITASSPTVTQGSSVTLTYSSTNATIGSLKDATGNVIASGPSGSAVVTPTTTNRTYTGTVSGTGNGTATCTASVAVTTATAPAPVISKFAALPISIQRGASTELSWTVSGATKIFVNDGSAIEENVTGLLLKNYAPTKSTTYTLKAQNSDGLITSSQPVSVTVTDVPLPPANPACTLTATPASITAGNTTAVKLVSSNATKGSNNFNTSTAASGTWSLSPQTTTLYSATVTNSANSSVTCVVNVTVTPVPATNLIQNGGFEIADPNSASSPANWSSSAWGGNPDIPGTDTVATFTYPVTGNGSNSAAKLDVTKVDAATYGGATWASPHVLASSNTIYKYSNDYKSNVVTNLSVEFLHNDNTWSYEWLYEPPATGAAWARQVAYITVPKDVKSFTVIHGLGKVGSLTLDNVSLVAMPASPFDTGMVTLTFDDGLASQYNNALPMLTAAAMPATFGIITGYPQAFDPLYMTWAQIQDLKTKGFEIAGHTQTHQSLTDVTTEQATGEINGSFTDLFNKNLTPTTMIYPYGNESPAIEKIAKEAGFKGARSSYFGFNAPFSNPYALNSTVLTNTTKFPAIKQQIDQAITDKRWVILQLHDVLNGGNEYSITPALMQEIINYIKSSGIRPVTLDQGVQSLIKQ